MILQNEICHIEISIDETYTVGSVDNRYYDVTLNPAHYRHNDLSKTLSIHRPRAQPPAQLVEWGCPPGAKPLHFRLKAVWQTILFYWLAA